MIWKLLYTHVIKCGNGKIKPLTAWVRVGGSGRPGGGHSVRTLTDIVPHLEVCGDIWAHAQNMLLVCYSFLLIADLFLISSRLFQHYCVSFLLGLCRQACILEGL